MSATLLAAEPAARYLTELQPALVERFDLRATAPGGVARLRELILTLAVQGKLVAQDPRDEPATLLLKANSDEKQQAMRLEGVRPSKPTPPVEEDEQWFAPPGSWAWTRLNDLVISSEAGWSPSCDEVPRQSGRWGVLKVSAVSWGKFDPNANKELPASLAPRPEYEVIEGDFLLSRANTAELVARSVVARQVPPRLMLSDKIIRLRLVRAVCREYVNLFNNCRAARDYYETNASGTSSSMKNVSREVVLGLPIALPPLPEQARIVARVDELMRLCDALEAKGRLEAERHAQLLNTLLGTLTDSGTAEELAANWQRVAAHFDLLLDRPEAVDALEQTILQLAVRGLLVQQESNDQPADALCSQSSGANVRQPAQAASRKAASPLPPVNADELPFVLPDGWALSRFGEVAQISGGVTLGRKGTIPKPLLLPYLRVANVQRWKLSLAAMKEVVIDESELPRYQVEDGDLLITEGGDWDKVGRTAIWRSELPVCLHQNHVFKARVLTPAWISAWGELFLNSDVARTYFAASAKQTTNLASINMTELKHCVFPLPPLAEQVRIVARVDQLRCLCADLRQRLADSQATQSRLAEALVESATA